MTCQHCNSKTHDTVICPYCGKWLQGEQLTLDYYLKEKEGN